MTPAGVLYETDLRLRPDGMAGLLVSTVAGYEAYQRGKALNMASHLELDDVIDPADTRRWLARGLASMPASESRKGRKRPFVDAW